MSDDDYEESDIDYTKNSRVVTEKPVTNKSSTVITSGNNDVVVDKNINNKQNVVVDNNRRKSSITQQACIYILDGKDLSEYDSIPVDEILAKLSPQELEQLSNEVDPDDTLLPPSQRCKDQTDKSPTRVLNREQLIHYYQTKYAVEQEDRPESKRYEPGVKKGKVFVPKIQPGEPKDEIPILANCNKAKKSSKRISRSKHKTNPSPSTPSYGILLAFVILCLAILIGVLATQLSSDRSGSKAELNIRLEDIDLINNKYPKLLSHRDIRVIKTRLAVVRQEVSILMLLGQVKDPQCQTDVTFCIAQTIANVTQVGAGYIDASYPDLHSSTIETVLESSLGKTKYSVVIDSLERLPGKYVMNLFKFIDRSTPQSMRGLILFVVYTGIHGTKDSSKHRATALAENILTEKWAQYIPTDTLDSVISRITGSVVEISQKKV